MRDRGLPNVLDFPMQDALARFAGGSAGATGIATRLHDDDYFVSPTASRTCRRRSSATTTSAAPRSRCGSTAAPAAAGRSCSAPCSRTTCSTSCAARRRLLRRRVRDRRPRRRQGGAPGPLPDPGGRVADARSASAAPPIGTGSSFDVPEPPDRSSGCARSAGCATSTRALDGRHDRAPRLADDVLAVSRIDAAGKREYLALLQRGRARRRGSRSPPRRRAPSGRGSSGRPRPRRAPAPAR